MITSGLYIGCRDTYFATPYSFRTPPVARRLLAFPRRQASADKTSGRHIFPRADKIDAMLMRG